jgi:hypothetical protein
MNIGFYGMSTASWVGDDRSFIDQVRERLGAKIVNAGVPQGSEERVLIDLKKTRKKVDVAVIFHSSDRNYLYLPKCNRDISSQQVPENKAKALWTEASCWKPTPSEFEHEFMGHGNIKEIFGTAEKFIECMTLYKEFLYSPELITNRYHGALVLIDSFCQQFIPKTIHIPEDALPEYEWLEFKSGITSHELRIIADEHYRGGLNPNNISDEGNRLIADKLVELIQQITKDESNS